MRHVQRISVLALVAVIGSVMLERPAFAQAPTPPAEAAAPAGPKPGVVAKAKSMLPWNKAKAKAAEGGADAAAEPKPGVVAKAKAMLPWNKTKAAADGAKPADAAAAPASKPVVGAGTAAAAAVVPAVAAAAATAAPKPAAKAAAPSAEASAAEPKPTESKAAAKPVATRKPAVAPAVAKEKTEGGGAPLGPGDQASGPMAATLSVFGTPENTPKASATVPRKAGNGCTRLAHSAIEFGKEKPTQFAREGLDNQIAALTKKKGWKAAAKSGETVACAEFLNLGLLGQEYNCRVEVNVCPK